MTQRKIAEAFPPGEFILEELEARGWSQLDLAEIIGCDPTVVNAWIKGRRAITPQTAKQLSDAFGTSAQLWMNLQSSYDLWKAEEADTNIARRARLYGYAPIKDMLKRQWIEASESVEVLERRILEFYGVESLDERPQQAYASRKRTPDELNQSQMAWLRRAMKLSKCVTANRFTDQSFEGALHALEPLRANAEDIRHIPKILAGFGIRLLIVEQLATTSHIDGVTFWRNQYSPVIALSVRLDRIDSFWFTLAHELGHVKYRDALNKPILIDVDLVGDEAQPFEDKSDKEKRADEFAAEFLVPQDKLESFIQRKGPLYSRIKITNFANLLRVHPGIVVGQLHHRGCFNWRYYRQMLEKVRHIVTGSALTDGWGHIPPAIAA